jgi:hypothetical protein
MLWWIVIIVIVIGVAMLFSGCGMTYMTIAKIQDMRDKAPYLYDTYYSSTDDEYVTKYAFYSKEEGVPLNRDDVEKVQYYWLDEGYRVSEIMWEADFETAYLWVYADDQCVDVPYPIYDNID